MTDANDFRFRMELDNWIGREQPEPPTCEECGLPIDNDSDISDVVKRGRMYWHHECYFCPVNQY